MIYSNRKEIEMKNANQINVNQINNINIKETVYMKKKEFIKNNIDQKPNNSFLVKRDNNINNYVLLEISHKKPKANKNLVEMKAKNFNDISNIKQNKLILRSNNENINNNNKNENISNNINIRNLNIVTKNEIKKINYNSKEDKKENKMDKENKKEIIKNDKNTKINIRNEKENKNENKIEEKNDKENETKKEKEEKNYKRIHILLSSSISKEKKAQRGLKNRDNIKLLYTYANNSNENNINKERKNSSNSKNKEKSIDNKLNNHSLYICDSLNNEKKYKKSNYSKEIIHKDNMSAQKYNCSFRTINSSHSKPKKLKTGISEKYKKSFISSFFHYYIQKKELNKFRT